MKNDKKTEKALSQTSVGKRYYFKTTGLREEIATERCMFKDDGVMIGSLVCQNCEYCIDTPEDLEKDSPDWIVCSKIKIASP